MAQNSSLPDLANFANSANEKLQIVREKFAGLQAKIQDVGNQIRYKQLAIDGRRQQASAADQRVSQLQQEYSSLINQSYNADNNELQHIQSRIQAVRSEAQRAQAQADQYRAEAQNLEKEKQQMQAEQRQLQGEFKEFQGKCKVMASYIGKQMMVAKRISITRENSARGLNNVSQIGFGSNAASSGSQWESREAQAANTIANKLDRIARNFRSMASNEDDRDSR